MNESEERDKKKREEDDLQEYLKDIKGLESNFSDLDDLDIEEIQEMQEAISKVKEMEETGNFEREEINKEEIIDDKDLRTAMISDFSDVDELDLEELKEMREAVESVKEAEIKPPTAEKGETLSKQEISQELGERIQLELSKRKEEREEKEITAEKFLDYVKSKRTTIWYHALYHLTFNVEDHIASKTILYDILKETTSKSPIDPIPEHKFYFGLGFLLRLSLYDKQIVRYSPSGKFKINIDINTLKEILKNSGTPISTRPVIKDEEKKKMFTDFLKDDFSDI